jgi:hypothetical protein
MGNFRQKAPDYCLAGRHASRRNFPPSPLHAGHGGPSASGGTGPDAKNPPGLPAGSVYQVNLDYRV